MLRGDGGRGSCFHGTLPRGGHVRSRCQSPCGELTNASMGSVVSPPGGPHGSRNPDTTRRRQHSRRVSSPPSRRHTLSCRSRAPGQRPEHRAGQIRQETCSIPLDEIPTLFGRNTPSTRWETAGGDTRSGRHGLKNRPRQLHCLLPE